MKLHRLLVLAVLAYAVPAVASDLSITQSNQTFSSAVLTVHAGDKVSFHNNDTVTHNITVKSASGDADDLGLQKPGGVVSYQFESKGTYRVVCSIHPRMKMMVNAE